VMLSTGTGFSNNPVAWSSVNFVGGAANFG
jgi:hypothetical protein